MLAPVSWSPPGVDLRAWRAAMAEHVVLLQARLAQAEAAIAVVPGARDPADESAGPRTRIYEVPEPTVRPPLRAAADDGFGQAAVIAADAPDVPGMALG